MAKAAKKLTDRQVRALPEGRYSDGDGLFLVVTQATRRWVFRYRSKREWGAGSAPLKEVRIGSFGDEADGAFGLASARRKAAEFRMLVADGEIPGAPKPAPRGAPTFGAMADELIEKRTEDYRSETSLSRLKMALEHHAKSLRDMPVDRITEDDVIDVLKPIWKSTPVMAEKVRGYIWAVLENANDHYPGRNPATWKGRLERRLPKRKRLKRGHHPALDRAKIPAFMTSLRARKGVGARAFEFLVLTAVRSNEVRLATWAEFNLKEKTWTIPAGRTKSEREHRVPLSDAALSVLEALGSVNGNPASLVFPGAKRGTALSVMTFSKIMRMMDIAKSEAVPHGFRATFRDWAEDVGGYSFELGEQALSHVVGDATARAYRRSDALERRRAMMDAWAAFCGARTDENPPARA